MKSIVLLAGAVVLLLTLVAAQQHRGEEYDLLYERRVRDLEHAAGALRSTLQSADNNDIAAVGIKEALSNARQEMKRADFLLRYLEPAAYRLINAPLPVEWETEVFEKFEKPYRREGGGLTLIALQLGEPEFDQRRLAALADSTLAGCRVFLSDSVRSRMHGYHHFYLCNRLFLLNLAAIYTTGFECPAPEQVIPELKDMLIAVGGIYQSFNISFPETPLPESYLSAYRQMVTFVNSQPSELAAFDHYTFIRDHVNPLFALNQQFITQYHVASRSLLDYSLDKKAVSIFDKRLYTGQNAKGIFRRVADSAALADIEPTGRLLFYDPILSGNNQRSCASCHKPEQCFTDTSARTAFILTACSDCPGIRHHC